MVTVDGEGFPIWGNPSPQKPAAIPGRQIMFAIQDAAINQIPGGRADEIPIIQKAIPRQANPQGTATGDLTEAGQYGSTLYDEFMRVYGAEGA